MKSWKKIFKWSLILGVLSGGGVWLGWHYWQGRLAGTASQVQEANYAVVRRGSLVINMIESGTIQPRKQHVIKSQVEGRVSITYIFPEGERVKKGQLLVKFDSSDFEDKLSNQEILAKNAEANLTQARENLEVVKNQAKADVAKAELDLRFAREDLVKYRQGEYPKILNEAEMRVTLANEELKRAKDKLEWSTRLFAEKYLSESDYRTDALSCKRYELELKSAENALNLLKDYTYKREVAKLESDVEQASMALERGRRKANADITQATATLNARELELMRQTDQVEKLRGQIAKCTILSPADGLVIYATSNQFWKSSNESLIDVGAEVYQRQDLIFLPESDEFKADIKIHETNLKKVYRGLPVRVTVDALQDTSFKGTVARVAPLPDAQSMFMNPNLKLYNSEVIIDGGENLLKSGMNCRAEVIIQQLQDVLYIPVQCVVRENDETVVYVRGKDGDRRRVVEIGLDNNQVVHIKSGLEEGEQVTMVPPLDRAEVTRDQGKLEQGLKIPPRPTGTERRGKGGYPGGKVGYPGGKGGYPGGKGGYPGGKGGSSGRSQGGSHGR